MKMKKINDIFHLPEENSLWNQQYMGFRREKNMPHILKQKLNLVLFKWLVVSLFQIPTWVF